MTDSWKEIWQLRTKLYSFLGNCLLEPIQGPNEVALSRLFWEGFPIEPANAQMKSGLEQLINCLTHLEALPEKEAVQNVMLEYTALFLGPGRPKASPWESVYRTQAQVLFGWPTYEVREALSLNGVEMKGKYRQPEDHIGIELMLLSVVSGKLEKLGESQQGPLVQDQISFIDNHLLSWIGDLCRDAKLNGSTGYYGGLIELIWGMLLWDRELLEEFSS
ncbi:Chaperone protein TorD [bioreactor metagenome]|uniref:Chaperone protein TorD n=1 Tax=bioreactor metagenome TaxID=1076179 RepID=A0A644V9C4_9ZZZZ|nr:molecular chaperone TorD family protein [Desulfitobacterium hafniense]MEA5025808.1 molecular chaperone TorD family protein [Desulfitobacterium hafniense]